MIRRAATFIALGVLATLASAGPVAAAPAWLAPTDLSAPGRDGVEPQVAVDAGGDTVAVWGRSNGSDFIIQASSRPAGGGWTPPVDLSAVGRSATEPQVAIGPGGSAVAVWARTNGAHVVVQGASKPAGGAWTPVVDLSDSDQPAGEPQVAIDSAGRAVAVWQRRDGFNTIVQSSFLASVGGGVWSKPVDLSAKGENAKEPQLGVDGAGNVVAVWTRLEGTDTIAQTAFGSSGGAWGAAKDLSKAGGDAKEPQIALDPGGGAVAVWSRTVGGVATVQAAEMAPGGGTWLEALDLTGAGEDATEPDVALAGGRAVAVWSLGSAGPYTSIESREKPNGGAWQPTQDLTQPGLTQTVVTPHVVIDPRGNAEAAWARSSASPTVIDGRTKPAGGAWTGIDELSELGFSSLEPQLAVGATGDGAAIWSRENGANTIVQAAGFDGAGPIFPSLSIPAAATVRQPVRFAASTFENWSPVRSIDWSFGDGGEGAAGSSVEHTFASPGTYSISILTADNLGNTGSAAGTITIYRLPNAGRNVRVRRGAARVMVHCPSPAGCTGVVRLIARVKLKRGGRSVAKRAQIGRTQFSVPGPGTTPVPIKLTRPGRAAVQEAGAKGVRTQLTGPGIQHRLLLLLPPRR
jgi:hypothetical protein